MNPLVASHPVKTYSSPLMMTEAPQPLAIGSGAFVLQTFVFRAVCGLILTAIYAFRGFAPAVWTHALYDVWVMVLY